MRRAWLALMAAGAVSVASGRSAQCVINPYFAYASQQPSARRYKRHRSSY